MSADDKSNLSLTQQEEEFKNKRRKDVSALFKQTALISKDFY